MTGRLFALLLCAAAPASAAVSRVSLPVPRAVGARPILPGAALTSVALPPAPADAPRPFRQDAPRPFQHDALRPLAPAAVGAARAVAFGDSGTADDAARRVADAIRGRHEAEPFATALVLGDNVYGEGGPERFEDAIAGPYAALRDRGVRFLPVLGNHDARQARGEAQLRYWGAPRFYSASFAGGAVETFAVDATLFLSEESSIYGLDAPWAEAESRRQLAWLEQALAASTARVKVVYSHYPLWPSSLKDKDLRKSGVVRAALEPLLRRHDVRLYLSGHEHHYRRSEHDGLIQAVSGAAGELDEDAPRATPETRAQSWRRHFLLLSWTGGALTVEAVAEDGTRLDLFSVPASRPPASGAGN